MDAGGLDALTAMPGGGGGGCGGGGGARLGNLARPRRLEVAAALNRLRGLRVQSTPRGRV